MSMAIVIEIVLGIFLLAAAVRFAVRDTRQRSGASPQQPLESEDAVETPARSSKREPEQDLSEVGSAESS